jgi:DNA-binding beta-propeller fold protein YncE
MRSEPDRSHPRARLAYPALALGFVLLLVVAIPALGSGGATLTYQECFNANGGSCESISNPGLGNADAIAVSPDGKSVYVASDSDSGVVRFDRDTSTGALTYGECLTSESSGCAVDNLPSMVNAQGVAISPDGKSVYVTSNSEGSVDHFERNTESGELTYKDCVSSRSSGCGSGDNAAGLSGAWGITVSPDGKDVYVAANTNEAIVSFARNETTGSLTDDGCLAAHNVGCVPGNEAAPGVVGATDIAVSPDGSNVYVAGGVPGLIGTLSTFKRSTSGVLTYEGCATSASSVCTAAATSEPGMVNARGVAVSPDGKSVYVAAESSGGAVVRFNRNTTGGALTYEGCLTSAASGCGTNSIAGLNGAFGIAVSPDGKSVYVTSLSHDNALVRLERDTGTGALSVGECFTYSLAIETACGTTRAHLPGLDGAERVAPSPDGKSVYVAASSGGGAVAVFGASAASGGEDGGSTPSPTEDGGRPTPAPAPIPLLQSPPPTLTSKPKPLKCKKGFQKKAVHGKAKCVKRKAHHAKPKH